MIPRRVIIPPKQTATAVPSRAVRDNITKPPTSQLDWDSPSSYTGTVKRRPNSFEVPKQLTPHNDCNNSGSVVVADGGNGIAGSRREWGTMRPVRERRCNIGNKPKDVEILSQEIVQGNCFPNQKEHEQRNQGLLQHQEMQESQQDADKNSVDDSACKIKSKLKQPKSVLAPIISAKSNVAKFSSIQKTSHLLKGSTDHHKMELTSAHRKLPPNNPQVQKIKDSSSSGGSTTEQKQQQQQQQQYHQPQRKNISIATTNNHGIGGGKKSEGVLADGLVVRKQRNTSLGPLKKAAPPKFTIKGSLLTELYRDFPPDTPTPSLITLRQPLPPPYRHPPNPPPPPPPNPPPPNPPPPNPPPPNPPQSTPPTPPPINTIPPENSPKHKSYHNEKKINSLHDNEDGTKGEKQADDCSGGSPSKNAIATLKSHLDVRSCISKVSRGNRFFSKSQCELNTTVPHAAGKNTKDKDDINKGSSNDYILCDPGLYMKQTSNADEDSNCVDILAKAEYSSSLFKNIPVRPRRGVPHLENYCLFDPSVDFINEKEAKKREEEQRLSNCLECFSVDEEELIEEIIYDDQLVYDTLEEENEEDECETIINENARSSYFTNDPELLEDSEGEKLEEQQSLDEAKKLSESETNTSTESSTSSSTHSSQVETSSSSDTSMINSVIDTSSTNFQSSDDYDTAVGLTLPKDPNIPKSISGSISDDACVRRPRSPHLAPVVILKMPPQIDKLFRQSSLPSPSKRLAQSNERESSKLSAKIDNEVNLEFPSQLTQYQEALKQSISSPQLRNRHRTLPLESNYVLFNPAPVPSRKHQYKIRQPRPLSTHSDADSGFLSPVTPDGPSESSKSNPTILVLEQCDSIQGYIEIYTDWANYYLERAKSKKKVLDLSADCRDGLLLADVIEAVTTFKVPDLIKKPKNQQQMYDNVTSCLNTLRTHSISGLEQITSNDICTGRLKAVLALFFALSRYKQASKQKEKPLIQQQQQPAPPANSVHANDMLNRQLPVPYGKSCGNGGTAIPLPATVMVTRRCPPDKVRPLPPTPGHQPSIPGLAKSGSASESSSRPGSPPGNGTPTHIPKGNNGLRQPQVTCKIPASPYSAHNNSTAPQLPNGTIQSNGTTKHYMLDKLKLFNKEKSDRSSKTQISKRTSSSSGFSSARSERSDSSLSLNDGHTQQVPSTKACVGTLPAKKTDTAQSLKSKTKLLPSKGSSKENISTPAKAVVKSEKKEKSPARKLSENQSATETKLQQKTTKPDSKMKQPKPTIVQQQQQPNTGIPKPMAAIKGQTKQTNSTSTIERNKQDVATHDNKHGDISSNISNNQIDTKLHIINPLSLDNGIPIASIHQMHQQQQQQQQQMMLNRSLSMSSDTTNGHKHASGLHSNASEPNVIYRQTCESDAALQQHLRMNGGAGILLSPQHHHHHLNGLPQQQQHGYGGSTMQLIENGNKFNTVPSKIVNTIYEEEKQMTVLPMRPLLRGYNSHVTLPTRTRGQHIVADYCEDIGQGYCSDGDALRKVPVRYGDLDNGYLSEGGGSMPNKHLLSVLRARTQLPTTIEERCRSSRGENIDSVGTTPPAMEQLNGGGNLNGSTNGNGGGGSHNRSRSNRDQWGKMPDTPNGHSHQSPSSPPSGRKEKGSPSHSRRSGSSSKSAQSRTKGVPQSFGFVKRTNGTVTGVGGAAGEQPQSALLIGSSSNGGRTAHVSAVPRTNKIKVSGGTQTCQNDMQNKMPPNSQHRSFSLTGPSATQLSQSIRERLSTGSHSLPKPGTELHVFQHRMSNRGSTKLTDGSLSDTQTYAEVKPEYSSYAMWLKHSNTAASRLSEGDSMENIGMGQPGMPRGHKLMARDSPYTQSPRLNRSNSIRSTKSEKMYPSMLSRGPDVEIEPYYCLPVGTVPTQNAVPWSQPTSPTPPSRGGFGPLSPTHANHRLTYPKKNDDVHGSAASLLSGGSSLYGSVEERQANEVRRLKRELADARDQVMSLSSQLSTNVSKFSYKRCVRLNVFFFIILCHIMYT